MWQYILLGVGILVAILLLKKYFSHQSTESVSSKFCFECNRNYPDRYLLCPKCGIKFGA